MTSRPFEAYRTGRLDQLDRVYTAHLEAGYPVTLGGNAETLQVSRDTDRTNWLSLLGMCAEAITAVAGDQIGRAHV